SPGSRLAAVTDAQVEAAIRTLSNWGRWGPDDELGTVNFITPARRVEAASLIRRGEVFSLAIPLDEGGPQPPFERRLNPRHLMLATGTDLKAGVQPGSDGGFGEADDMVVMALQAATQWDSLAHIFYGFKMYNDRDCTLVNAHGASKNSIAVLRERVVSRGVLVDLPRFRGVDWLPADHRITVAGLEGALDRQRVEVRSGDVLLIRTGNMRRIRASGSWTGFTYADEPGIGLDALPWIHEKQVAAAA